MDGGATLKVPDKILAAVTGSEEAMSTGQIVALNLGETNTVYMAIYHLFKDGKLSRHGQRGSFVYSIPGRFPEGYIPPRPEDQPLPRKPRATAVAAAAPKPPVEHQSFATDNPVGDALVWLRRKRAEIDTAIAAIEALAK